MLVLTVANPPRGAGSQPAATLQPQTIRGTFAWSGTASTATLVYVGDAPVTVGASVTIQLGAHYFAGICKSDTQLVGSRGGQRELVFVDLRDFLTWDWIFCAFNMPVRRLVGGVWKKRYWHIYPGDFDTYTKTWTDIPLTAAEIVNAIFHAPTIGSPWSWDLTGNGLFPGGVMSQPIFSFNCLNGVRLDAALNEISEKGCVVFTHTPSPSSLYHLTWTRKGYGVVPFFNPALVGAPTVPFPDNADERRSGLSLSGHATNVRILGERNRYQIINLPLAANWSPAWEQFLVNEGLYLDIYNNERDPATGQLYTAFADDAENWKGAYAARVRSLEITVGEYVAMRNNRNGTGDQFIDSRKFAGRCRMDMPAALYIQNLVFRAYVPATPTITNSRGAAIPLESVNILDAMPCRVNYDPLSGAMNPVPTELIDGNGLAIVRGAAFGQDMFRLVEPERVTSTFFSAASRAWAQVPFQIDDSGEGQRFIIFEAPVFTSENLMTTVDGMNVLNAQATISAAAAQAALTFEMEPFSYWKGTYPNVSRDRTEYVSGLCEEYVGMAGTFQRIRFANGKLASDQADQIAAQLLLAQYIYASGGYKLNWKPNVPVSQFGTFLNSVIDRVDFEAGPAGVMELVDFTTERERDHFEPERDLERRTQQNSLFPGQMELKQIAQDYKRFAAGIKSTPRNIFNQFIEFLKGNFDNTMIETRFASPTSTLIPVGTPIVKKPTLAPTGGSTASTQTLATDPTAVSTDDKVLVGVTVRHNEDPRGVVHVKRSGKTLARVKGPVGVNDAIGLSDAGDHFIKDGTPSVGRALQEITTTDVKLIEVFIGAGGGSGDSWPPKDYSETISGLDTDGTFAKGTWVWVTATSEAVTAGIIDPDSAVLVHSEPGLYRALRDIEPVGPLNHHIPLANLPDPSDILAETNYWLLISPALNC